ncbi:MAG: hypothetical protein K5888_00735 [Lachnospiraceae bacterium]|nr:hypothetical protein [Lachnospiraceae bacterium]
MKRMKKLLAVVLATVTVALSSVSAFADLDTSLPACPALYIYGETESGVFHVLEGCGFAIVNAMNQKLTVYGDGAKLFQLEAMRGDEANVQLVGYDIDGYISYSYKKGSKKLYLQDVTEATLAAAAAQAAPAAAAAAPAAAQAAPAAAQAVAQAAPAAAEAVAQAAPAAAQAAQEAFVPDLSDPAIKALWEQAVTVKQAYDAETNAKKKKELQKQFTALMDQLQK